MLLKPNLYDFGLDLANMWNEDDCADFTYSLALLSLVLEWKLNFSCPVATAEFSNFAGILSVALWQNHVLGFEIAQLEFHDLHSIV